MKLTYLCHCNLKIEIYKKEIEKKKNENSMWQYIMIMLSYWGSHYVAPLLQLSKRIKVYFGPRRMRKTIYCTFHIQRNVGMELESVRK